MIPFGLISADLPRELTLESSPFVKGTFFATLFVREFDGVTLFIRHAFRFRSAGIFHPTKTSSELNRYFS